MRSKARTTALTRLHTQLAPHKKATGCRGSELLLSARGGDAGDAASVHSLDGCQQLGVHRRAHARGRVPARGRLHERSHTTSHTSNVFTCTSRTSTLNHMQSTPIHMHFNARLVQAQHLHHARAHASQWSRPSQGLSTTAFTGTPTHMHKIRHHTYRHLQTHHSHSQAHLHHTQHLSTSTSTNPSTCNHLDTRHHVQAHHTCTKVTSKHIIYMINKHTSYKTFNIDAE